MLSSRNLDCLVSIEINLDTEIDAVVAFDPIGSYHGNGWRVQNVVEPDVMGLLEQQGFRVEYRYEAESCRWYPLLTKRGRAKEVVRANEGAVA